MVRRTKEEAAETREQVLDAAEQVFRQRGVGHASLAEVADAAGVTRGAIYHHFASKAELFEAMLARAEMPIDMAFDATRLPVADPLAMVRDMAVKALQHLASCDRVRNIFEVAFLRCEYTDELGPVEQRHLREREQCLALSNGLLDQAVARGQLPTRTRTRAWLSRMLYGFIGGLMRDWVQAPDDFRHEHRRAAGCRSLPRRPPRRASPPAGVGLNGSPGRPKAAMTGQVDVNVNFGQASPSLALHRGGAASLPGVVMTDLSEIRKLASYRPKHKVRFVTAASLFDGHDASINIMRRILQSMGAEVIHLGHNRSVDEVVTAALQEDVQGIAVSSYQGGHVEFFKYMLDLLRERGGSNIRVYGGGGGVIVPEEIKELHDYGVARIFSPEDGQKMGLAGMIGLMVAECDHDLGKAAPTALDALKDKDATKRWRALAQLITALELNEVDARLVEALHKQADTAKVPVLGVTGTGGAGKSSLTDELVRRLRLDQGDQLNIAVISIDPSRRKSGGALLGDRIRMNAIGPWRHGPKVYMRSLATREAGSEISEALPHAVAAAKVAGFDVVIVETSGIGQGDAAVVPHVDLSLYVMTPEYGAASQLEKIDMLDFADFVAINKFDRKGAADALRDVAKQVQRNKGDFAKKPDEMPVFGTMAARFNDDGVTALYQALLPRLKELGLKAGDGALPKVTTRHSTNQTPIVPPSRTRYLAEISDTVRGYKKRAIEQSRLARQRQQLREAKRMLATECKAKEGEGSFKLLTRISTRSPPIATRSWMRAARSCSTCGRRCGRRTRATSTS